MCIEMFPKNKINIIYRFLCLISYLAVILVTNSNITLFILLFMYFFLGLSEKSFRNIEFIVITLILLLVCYLLKNYWLFRIMLVIDYSFYFLDTPYYGEDEVVSKNDYVRFVKVKKKKGSNNITAVFVTLHLVILLLAIVVG